MFLLKIFTVALTKIPYRVASSISTFYRLCYAIVLYTSIQYVQTQALP